MAIRPKTQVGTMPCLCCDHEVPVKAGDSGTLNFSCPWCDFPGYAKAGTEAHRIISKKMKPIAPVVVVDDLPVKPPAAKASSKTMFG